MDEKDENDYSESENESDDSDNENENKARIAKKKKAVVVMKKNGDDSDYESDIADSDEDDGDNDNDSDIQSETNENPDIENEAYTGILPDLGTVQYPNVDYYDDDEDEDNSDEKYLQKFSDNILKKNVIAEYHPELKSNNFDEVETMCTIVRDKNGIIIDPLHRTLPFITKYEKARIIGERAKQINAGAKPFVEVDNTIIDGYLIAMKEFEMKKIPFIIQRPIPDGTCEYWKLKDLEFVDF